MRDQRQIFDEGGSDSTGGASAATRWVAPARQGWGRSPLALAPASDPCTGGIRRRIFSDCRNSHRVTLS